MILKNANVVKEYKGIIKIDGVLRNFVTSTGTTKLGYMDQEKILVFETEKKANEWIDRNTYKGMSFHYEVVTLHNTRETKYKWDVKRL